VTRTFRIAGALLAAVAVFATAGCDRTEVQDEYSPADGSKADNEFIGLRNVLVVTDGEGSNAIIVSISNKTEAPEFLDEVSAQGTPVTRGSVPIPAGGAVSFGSTDRPGILVPGDPSPGTYVDLVFSFRAAGDLPVSALVVNDSPPYDGVIEAAKEGQPRPVPLPATAN
jgi:hypothetical protein